MSLTWSSWRAAVLSVSLAALGACITPPLVKPAGVRSLELSADQRALGAEHVEIDVGNGERLRGVFVPGRADAGLVLHFLGSGASVTTGQEFAGLTFDIDGLFAELQDLGLGSLAVDYRGVGASDGECDPEHVPADALAAWNEALRRVDGDPRRVCVRGLSLGTLAAASLLERGFEPQLLTLVAPVRAETAADNFVRARYGTLGDWFVSPFLAQPMKVDLCAALSRASCSPLIHLARDDVFLPPDEQQLVREAARQSHGACFDLDLDHVDLVHRGYRLFEIERQLLEVLTRRSEARADSMRRAMPPSCLLQNFEHELDVVDVDVDAIDRSVFSDLGAWREKARECRCEQCVGHAGG